MHLKEILHPEIILNRRGPKNVRQSYQGYLSELTYINGGVAAPPSTAENYSDALTMHLTLCKKFSVEKPNVYYASQDFLNAVDSMDNKIPLDLLPSDFFGYIAFPKNSVQDSFGKFVQGAYVFLGDAKNMGSMKYGPNTKLFKVSCINDANGTSYLNLPITSDERFSEQFSHVPIIDSINGKKSSEIPSLLPEIKRERVYRILLNLVLYIHAENAELELLRPTSNPHLSKTKLGKIKSKNNGKLNTCTVPITLVNFDFHQGRKYSVDGTIVKGHFRHQRCGQGWLQYRTIWIDSHDRKYKQSTDESNIPEATKR